MFIISKGVAEGIRALGAREDVQRELDAIRAMPDFEIYANAIAEGVAHDATEPRATRHQPDRPDRPISPSG